MKVVLLLAGKGTRLLPLTETTPKPLLPVAGAPVLEHILRTLQAVPVEELIVIAGHLRERFEAYLAEHYAGPYRIITQARLNGTGGAVNAARDHLDCPTLIIFGDSIFKADLSELGENPDQNVIWTQTVEDYGRFGIVQEDDLGYMTTIVEKPKVDVGRQANIGVYYVADHQALRESLERIMSQPPITGEYYFTYALNDMIEHGHRFKVARTDAWHDCGDPASLLASNRELLSGVEQVPASLGSDVTIVPPVAIHRDARLRDCRIGPNVSIASGCRVVSSALSDVIVGCNTSLENIVAHRSIIGDGETLKDLSLQGAMAAHGKIVRTD